MNKKEMLSLAVTLCLLASWNGAEAAVASNRLFRLDYYSCGLLSPCSGGVTSGLLYGGAPDAASAAAEDGGGLFGGASGLFLMDASGAEAPRSSTGSGPSLQSMADAQRNAAHHRMLSLRLDEAFTDRESKAKIPARHLEEGAALPPAGDGSWMKPGEKRDSLQGGIGCGSSATLVGWDRAVTHDWRAGIFAGYGRADLEDDALRNELRDTRLGLYSGYRKAGMEGMVYLDYGRMRNRLRRDLAGPDLVAGAGFRGHILELGGEYLHDLHADTNAPWHVRPYVDAQLSRLWQDGYQENGAGVFNQVVDEKNYDYVGAGAGVEFKRYLTGGNYAIRTGVKHAFAGAEPKLRYRYMGDSANTCDMSNEQDRTHVVLSLGGESGFAKGWTVGGDTVFQRGARNKDMSCAVTVKRIW